MTKDVIALTPRMPEPWTVLAGLLSGGPDKLVDTTGEGAVVQLCDEQGRPLVSVEAPLLVQVEGEAERLLGATPPRVPFWWTEARATTGVPEAERLAGTFAARIASLGGGAPGRRMPRGRWRWCRARGSAWRRRPRRRSPPSTC